MNQLGQEQAQCQNQAENGRKENQIKEYHDLLRYKVLLKFIFGIGSH